jgi:hypothetical protein
MEKGLLGIILVTVSIPMFIFWMKQRKKFKYKEDIDGGTTSLLYSSIACLFFGVLFILLEINH